MARFSRYSKKTGEVPSKHDDNRLRRTAPADVGPPSPAKLKRIFDEGRETISRKDWLHSEHQENQMPEDKHDNGRGRYDNDTTGWSRGGDLGGDGRPGFDRGKLDQCSKPMKPTGPRNSASGSNMTKSPFSAAHKTYGED